MTRQIKADSIFAGNFNAYFSANGDEVVASESGFPDKVEDVVVYAAYKDGVPIRQYRHNQKPYALPVGTYGHVWHGTTMYAASSLQPISTYPNVRGTVRDLAGKGNMWVKTGENDDTLYYYNLFTNHRVNIDTVPDSRNSSFRLFPFPDQEKLAVVYGGVRVTIHSWSDIPYNDTAILTTPKYRRYQYDTVSFRAITSLHIDTATYEWYIGDTLYATTTDPHVIVRPRTPGEFVVRLRIVDLSGELRVDIQLDSTLTIEPRKGTTVIGYIDGWDPLGMEITAGGSKMILKTYGAEHEYVTDTNSTPWITTPVHSSKPLYISYRDQQSNIITATFVRMHVVFDFVLACHRRHPLTLESSDSTSLIDINMSRSSLPHTITTERFTTLLVDEIHRDTMLVMHKRSYYDLSWAWATDIYHISDENGFLQEARELCTSFSSSVMQPYDSHNGTTAFIQSGKRIIFPHLHRVGSRSSISMSDVAFTAVHVLDSNTIVTNAGVYTWDTTWIKTDSLPYDDIVGFVRIPESTSLFILRRSADTACVLYSIDSTHQPEVVGSTIGSIRTFSFDRGRKRMYVLDDHNVLHLWDLTGLPVYTVDRPIDTQDDSTDIGIVQRIECYDLMGRLLQRVNGSTDNHSSCRGLPHIVIHHGEHGMRRTQVLIGE